MGQGSPSTWEHTANGIFGENGDLVCDADDPTDCTHLTCNVGQPKGFAVQTSHAQNHLEAIVELAARWHRADSGRADEFTAGRMNGYEQAIGLLLGCTQPEVRKSLMEGIL